MSRRPTTHRIFEFTVKMQVQASGVDEASRAVDAACGFITDVYQTDDGHRIAAFMDDGEGYEVD